MIPVVETYLDLLRFEIRDYFVRDTIDDYWPD